jgi:thiol-disulfide isomerase/thioredoxin
MRKISLIIVFALFTLCSIGQEARAIMRKTLEKCQSIQNGFCETTKYFKSITDNDTSVSKGKYFFKKIQGDTLFPMLFHTYWIKESKSIYEKIYTGQEVVNLDMEDSNATVTAISSWGSTIRANNYLRGMYSPFWHEKCKPILHDSDFVNNKYSIKLLGEVILNKRLCYHLLCERYPKFDSSEKLNYGRIEFQFWVNVSDYIPVQYSINMIVLSKEDTMVQYDKWTLGNYDLTNTVDEKLFSLLSIPSYCKIKDYAGPQKEVELLPVDTIAPAWELKSLTNENVSLASLKGKLVLIDFFYKSCYPCMLALPVLQSLHEKYKDKGLMIIGIDPYDKRESNIAEFLAKRGITYPVLLEGKQAANDYHVTGYPTIYLIDKNGIIIKAHSGYGEGTEKELTKLIENNLD